VPHPFREPLQFIVMSVMSVISGTFPDTYGVFYVTINSWRVRDRHVIVMLVVVGKMAYVRDFLPGMTDMTLMTVLYGLILDRERISTSYALALQLNPTNPTHRARSPVPMRSLRPLAASGLSNLPDYLTPLPDDGPPFSSGLYGASSGQQS
jgi:hypothetical protein